MQRLAYGNRIINADTGRIVHMVQVSGMLDMVEIPTAGDELDSEVSTFFGTMYRNGLNTTIHEVLIADGECILLGQISNIDGLITLRLTPDVDVWKEHHRKIGVVMHNYGVLIELQKADMKRGTGLLCPWDRSKGEMNIYTVSNTLEMYGYPFQIELMTEGAEGEESFHNVLKLFNDIESDLYLGLMDAIVQGKKCDIKIDGYFDGEYIGCMRLSWDDDDINVSFDGFYSDGLPYIILMYIKTINGWLWK